MAQCEILACVDRFGFNWEVACAFANEVAPLLTAGTLHQIAIVDNTASNLQNPDATVWVGYGQFTRQAFRAPAALP